MNHVIRGNDVTEAWMKSISHLEQNGREDYNLIVEIENPSQDCLETRKRLNTVLTGLSFQTIETVASTIFPVHLLSGKPSRTDFYQRFYRIYPKLRRVPDNRKGTYFGRLVGWGFTNSDNPGFNQIEDVITKLSRERQNGRGIRVMYEMSIYNPELDHTNQMGFPCMSFISIKIRDSYVDLVAVYRNQHFIKKAYGNYLGLGMLQRFICEHSGFRLGKLTCIATHAELESVKKASMIQLLQLASSVEQMQMDSLSD